MQKRQLIFLSITILFTVISTNLPGQIWVENKAIYDEAESFLDGEEFEEALPLFLLLEKKGVTNSNICYKIGLCLFKSADQKSKAIPYLESAVANVKAEYVNDFSTLTAPVDALFLLGISYRVDYQFNKSTQTFLRVKKETSDTLQHKLADYYIEQCAIAQSFLKYPATAEIQLVEDKGLYSVYNPVLPDDNQGLYYFMQKRKFYDAVVKSKITTDYPPEVENLTPAIGSDGDLKLSSMSADSKTMLLTGYDAGNGFELYFSKIDSNGNWGNYSKYPEPINSPSNETGASLTSDGKKLYLCSNRPGGVGGYDIYKSELQADGNWSEPQNLGKTLNTGLNEISPYISEDGSILYFCSEAYLNMGGYDVFYSGIDEQGQISYPVNLGSPVSTPGDDIFISTSNDKNTLFTYRFDPKADNRNKICKIKLLPETQHPKLFLQGKLEFNDSVPAKAVVYNVVDKSTSKTKIISETSSDGSFDMFLPAGDFKLNFLYSNDISASQSVSVLPNQPIDRLNIVAPDWNIRKQQPLFTLLIRDILFDFNSYRLPANCYSMLDSIADNLRKYNDVSVSISGYTDAIGTDAYNLKLSEWRANAAKIYLLSKGISGDRITVSGKGENNPVAINSSAAGRKYNRRVAIEIQFNNNKILVKDSNRIPEELVIQ
jgi:outer membrane protein OmpA-like peptidoglycan-associated protein